MRNLLILLGDAIA